MAKRSLVWKYFTRVSKEEAGCDLCGKSIRTTGGATTGLHKHLSTRHREEFEQERKPPAHQINKQE